MQFKEHGHELILRYETEEWIKGNSLIFDWAAGEVVKPPSKVFLDGKDWVKNKF